MPAEIPEGVYRRVYDRLAEQFDFDPKRTQTVEALRDKFGWSDLDSLTFNPQRLRIRPYDFQASMSTGSRGVLTASRFVRGEDVRQAFREVVTEPRVGTVEIHCDGRRAALGTIVDSAGFVVTKASQLSGEILCRLHDGRRLPARRVHDDAQHDLAILQIDAKDLQPVRFVDASSLRAGDWVATAGIGRTPVSVGVLSVPQRRIARTRGILGIRVDENFFGRGVRVDDVYPESGADAANIKPQDLIEEINGVAVRSFEQLVAALQKYRSGDTVEVTLRRSGNVMKLSATLGTEQDVFSQGGSQMNGPLSRRRNDFPAAIQHDTVLKPNQCGGPVVNLAGRVVAVNIARADRIGSYAIPSETIESVLNEFRTNQSTD